MEEDVAEVLITAEAIARRVGELAAGIEADFRDGPMTVVIVSNGALIFAADLVRRLRLPLELDLIAVKSYDGTRSRERLDLHADVRLCLTGRQVLLVDDIFDTGLTLTTLRTELERRAPTAVRTCVLLRKEGTARFDRAPDYVGFTVPDRFVVGYGLDYRERYRNLPYVGVLHADLYADEPREAAG